jgi:hypothetical protein
LPTQRVSPYVVVVGGALAVLAPGAREEVERMPFWAWIVVAVVVGAVVAVLTWQMLSSRRTHSLRQRFGPEYDRTLETRESREEAEAELQAREERRRQLDIRPLPPATRDRYAGEWRQVQARFVDDPGAAVGDADRLIQQVMAERGYPVEDFEQRVADVSVDHPHVVEHYRKAHAIAAGAERGDASTEDLRLAMQHYRALFDDLLETSADEPLAREGATDVAGAERTGR